MYRGCFAPKKGVRMTQILSNDPKVTQNRLLPNFILCKKVRKIPVFVVNTGYFYGCGGLLHLVCTTWTNRIAA